MKSDFVEVKCGNCRFWYPWKAFTITGVRSERRTVEMGNATGCDGKCVCYEGRDVKPGPRDSSDTVTASYCKFYSN